MVPREWSVSALEAPSTARLTWVCPTPQTLSYTTFIGLHIPKLAGNLQKSSLNFLISVCSPKQDQALSKLVFDRLLGYFIDKISTETWGVGESFKFSIAPNCFSNIQLVLNGVAILEGNVMICIKCPKNVPILWASNFISSHSPKEIRTAWKDEYRRLAP